MKTVIAWRERELGNEATATIEAKLQKAGMLLEVYKYSEVKSILSKVERQWNLMTRETREQAIKVKQAYADKVYLKSEKDGLRIYKEMVELKEK